MKFKDPKTKRIFEAQRVNYNGQICLLVPPWVETPPEEWENYNTEI